MGKILIYTISSPSLKGRSKMKCGIYKITNKLTKHSYIGQSIDIRTRYNSRERKYQVYKLYQDRIGKSGFNKI